MARTTQVKSNKEINMQHLTTNESAQHLTPAEHKAEFIHWYDQLSMRAGEVTLDYIPTKAEAIELHNGWVMSAPQYFPEQPCPLNVLPDNNAVTWGQLAASMRAFCEIFVTKGGII